MKDAARQPGVRTHRLVGRDLSIDNPRADAAAVIVEATANSIQFTVVQLFLLPIAVLVHLCLPLLKEGAIPSHRVVAGVSQSVLLDCDAHHRRKRVALQPWFRQADAGGATGPIALR